MKHILLVGCYVVLFALTNCIPARGEEVEDEKLQETIVAFVNAVRVSNITAARAVFAPEFAQRFKTLPKYPILNQLGAALLVIDFEKRTILGGAPVVIASIKHSTGRSKWQFRTSGSRLADAQFLDAAVYQGYSGLTSYTGSRAKKSARSRIRIVTSCEQAPSLCSPSAEQSYDARLVEFFYATDRAITISKNVATIDTDRGRTGQLSYGVAAVHIPEDHEPGRIELPSEWRFLGFEFKSRTNDDKHFSIKRLASLSLSEWKALMTANADKSALVFVHGFNTSFEEALFRNAQIVWDLGFEGTSVLYSWSSKGKVRDYVYDRDSADIAQPGFISLLGTLKENGIEHVSVIAHSMGNRVVMPALNSIATTGNPAIKLDHLVMAAPDVARDMFLLQLPSAQRIAEKTTLYASAADKALLASSALADFPRAGLVPAEGPVVAPHLDTIDATAVGKDVLGLNHSVFAINRSVMDDLKLLLIDGMKLPRLTQVLPVPGPPAEPQYWKFR